MPLTIKKACGSAPLAESRRECPAEPRQSPAATVIRGKNVPAVHDHPHPWGKISFCRLLGLIYFVKVK
jgi:hypothetical protein